MHRFITSRLKYISSTVSFRWDLISAKMWSTSGCAYWSTWTRRSGSITSMSCYASKSFGIMILMGSKLIPVSTGELLLLFPHVVAPLMSIISGVPSRHCHYIVLQFTLLLIVHPLPLWHTCIPMYLSSSRSSNTASIRCFFGIQWLDLSISESIR